MGLSRSISSIMSEPCRPLPLSQSKPLDVIDSLEALDEDVLDPVPAWGGYDALIARAEGELAAVLRWRLSRRS